MQDLVVKAPKSKVKGHSMILAFRTLIMEHLSDVKDKVLIEVGSERGSGSTFQLANWAKRNHFGFISVDADANNSSGASEIVKKINPSFEAHHRLGEEFLGDYPHNNIGVLYLDAFDLVTDWPHIQSTVDSYAKRNAEFTNEAAYKMHYDATINSYKKVVPGGFICFDDVWLDEQGNWQGKGKTAIPFLIDNGFKVVFYRPNSLLMQRIEGSKPVSFAITKGKLGAIWSYYKNKI